ncbi:trans-4-hydroxy-L-proline dehydratase activase [Clostridium tarantellae]|uniref:Glycyl-radical enzyme activating protein n=1 Tax=Clostridium tarantellae TaxID=39493 RepID=A0A6I1MQM8_9CLOT|nr:trans-4-hydroxy-L-proline dehydratase activase [Clostridium tarantellae]MPQ43181.1 glycyl-radical enzyme activating protein [Clostridium tarantellae]
MIKGTVLNIQKYSVHDGPGIRTTIFFKGCPLKCWWCHNPESHKGNHEIMFFKERCTSCGKCIKRCLNDAITMKDGYPIINEDKCKLCGKCSEWCVNEALEYVGKDVTAENLMKEILKDEVFYEQSNGGVTFSGGEPLNYADFLNEVLKRCKNKGIHTAIETSGYTNWENFNKIYNKVDLFLYDIKLMNNEKHKKYTGKENNKILENLKILSEKDCNIIIRMPIIAGINDDDNHIDETIKYISKLNIIEVNLLPYHKMGMDKYKRLNLSYRLSGMEKPSDIRMVELEQKFKDAGIKVKIGG